MPQDQHAVQDYDPEPVTLQNYVIMILLFHEKSDDVSLDRNYLFIGLITLTLNT